MHYKVESNLVFNNKRNKKLLTPCCNKSNADGKFITYKNHPEIYGYCHSCGKSSLPPTVYKDEKGDAYIWDKSVNKFVNHVLQTYDKPVLQVYNKSITRCNTIKKEEKNQQFIDKDIVNRYYNRKPENNLLRYLRNTYGNTKVDLVKKMYYIGTCKELGTIFWSINSENKAQKAKISFYKLNGKRTNYFKVPYKNEDGYYNCLFGEHLINIKKNKNKPIVLVESEKTAIVCTLHYPQYVWLSYGGINGLTNEKTQVLIGRKVLLVPDMSENAITIINKKIPYFINNGIDAKIWDLTNGKSDLQLKNEGWYNCDLEDIWLKLKNINVDN